VNYIRKNFQFLNLARKYQFLDKHSPFLLKVGFAEGLGCFPFHELVIFVFFCWSGWPGSNGRPPGPKPGDLPTDLHPDNL